MNLFSQAVAAVDANAFGRVIDPIISNIVNPVVMLLFAIGLIVFAYGIFEMVWKGGDPAARSKGKMHMLGGLVGMFIMISAWGIIYLISNTIKEI
jgi:TRAP-type C4-dicarboxylate transport system permease small subunit